jgi:hypothetical protein
MAGANTGGDVQSNVFVGTLVGAAAQNVGGCIFVAPNFLGSNVNGSQNSMFFGVRSGSESSLNCIYMGIGSGAGNSAGLYFNIGIGNDALVGVNGGSNIAIGGSNTLPAGTNNGMVIGGVIYGTGIRNIWNSSSPNPIAGGKIGIGTNAPREALEVNGAVSYKYKELPADPTTTDIPNGYAMLVRNTSNGNVYLWANVGGAMVKAQFN